MITSVKVGDKVRAISVNPAIGHYRVGDVLTVVENHNGNAYILEDEIEIAALTTSRFAGENKKRFETLSEGFSVQIVIDTDQIEKDQSPAMIEFGKLLAEHIDKKYKALSSKNFESGVGGYFADTGLGVAEAFERSTEDLKAGRTVSSEQLKRNLSDKYRNISPQGESVQPIGEDETLDNLRETIGATELGRCILGVARPDLETRKIGKNRVELVDKGFPNALWEIARLMTKAQEVKQYKDHDWLKLPSNTFASAASRHRMKHNMGELYDDEFLGEGFKILHKANEAFNVLAELELLIKAEQSNK